MEGVRRGQKGLYVTLSESKTELLEIADSHGWSLDGIELFELVADESIFSRKRNTRSSTRLKSNLLTPRRQCWRRSRGFNQRGRI